MSVNFPRMFMIRQDLPHSSPLDIRATVQSQLALKIGSRVAPGARIAVTAGSRGISNLQEIVRATVDWLKERGAAPFIVPAMGSHGGATAEGQASVVADYGITEPLVGAPIKASMDTKFLGVTDDGLDVYFSAEALGADGILVVNRVKPHTDFSGKIGSGILKMITIGLGKRTGASASHKAFALRGHEAVIRSVAGFSLEHAPILGGIAILEDARHGTAQVSVLAREEIVTGEEQLFAQAKQLMPRLPFEEIDFLIIDQMGKNISGAGMDPNIIGRSVYGYMSQGPAVNPMSTVKIRRIFVRDLTPESHGNAIGVGLADFATSRLIRAMDPRSMYVNALTALSPLMVKTPIHFEADSEIITWGLASLGITEGRSARVVRISSTLALETMQVAEAFSEEVASDQKLTTLNPPEEMQFDSQQNLLPF